jgi:RimJ/RimL family protein N-acetyltransferase/GrpB-like predicted nucleotidyltransferase (UPF0157 family)
MNGQQLAGAFWTECVQPALVSLGLDDCGAALLGHGSEVLGLDDDRSADHDFGPRVQVFVAPHRVGEAAMVEAALDAALPGGFGGRPVRYPTTKDATARHRVEVTSVADYFTARAGFDPTTGNIPAADWLQTPTSRLAGLTAGAVFADPSRELAAAREALAWYPTDVWRYVLACEWHRLARDESFLGRTGEIGDDAGSRLTAARLARDLMRLGFLIERRWAPYAKWLGTAFGHLDLAADVGPHLSRLLEAPTWTDREAAYLDAGAVLAERFNALGLTEPVDPSPQPFFDRPFRVLAADRFALAIRSDSPRRHLGWRGAIDQWVDNAEVLSDRAFVDSLYPTTLTMPTLAAHGYRVRPFRLTDLELIREAAADPLIPLITTVPVPFTEAAGRDYIRRQWSRSRDGIGYSWVIARAESDRAVGSVGLWLDHSDDGRASIGYWVVPSDRGAGAAGRALAAVSTFAFETLGVPRLELSIEPSNTASIRAAERGGFRREGLRRAGETVGAERRNMWMYARLRDDDDPGDLPDRLRHPVNIVGPLDRWADDFQTLAGELSGALGALAVRIDHIGSTSVPGLAAKDVIDAQVIVASLHPEGELVEVFGRLGFDLASGDWNRRDAVPASWNGPSEAWDKLVFAPVDARSNVHVRVDGSPNARRPLLFRDYLRSDPVARDAWGAFKTILAGRISDLAAYGQVKNPATDILLVAAERWADETGWSAPASSVSP